MPYTRRALLGALSGAAGLSTLRSVQASGRLADPLSVRADFPVADTLLFLNSAYITPTPIPVVDAGREFAESKGYAPIALGDMLRKTNAVRAQYAKLINASPDEIGFLFATSEGENVAAHSMHLGRGDNVVIDELHYETEFVLYTHLAKTTGAWSGDSLSAGGSYGRRRLPQQDFASDSSNASILCREI